MYGCIKNFGTKIEWSDGRFMMALNNSNNSKATSALNRWGHYVL